MGTRSITRIHDGDKSSPVILTMYRQMDGYIEGGHGDELVKFLKPFSIVNGITFGKSTEHLANGMGCLAAQIVQHFKSQFGIGGIYITDVDSEDEEFTYDVYQTTHGNVVVECLSLDGLVFLLNGPQARFSQIAEFVYPDKYNVGVWREVGITNNDDEYVEGIDLSTDTFKKFCKDKIVGGKNKLFIKPV